MVASVFIIVSGALVAQAEETIVTDNTNTNNTTVNSTTDNTNTNINTTTSTNTNNNTNVNTSTIDATNTNINTNTSVIDATNTNINTNTSTVNSTNVNTNNNILSGGTNNTNTNTNINTSTSDITSNNTNTNVNTNNTTLNSTTNNTNTNNNTNNTTVNETSNATINSTSNNTNTNNNNNNTNITSNNTNTNNNTNNTTVNSTSNNTNTNNNNNTNRNYNESKVTQEIKSPPPSAIAPSVSANNSDMCTTGRSGAVQTQILGIAAGGTVRDMNCERLKLSKTLYDMGMKVAAVSVMCQDERVFAAMEMAGTPCPFMGDIGEEATAAWALMPELRPDAEEYKARQEYIEAVKEAIANGEDPSKVEKREPIDVDESFFMGLGAGALLLLLL